MKKAKNQCCSNGPRKVRSLLQLQQLSMICAALCLATTSLENKQMQVQAFVVAPPPPAVLLIRKNQYKSSSSKSLSSSSHLIVFGRFVLNEETDSLENATAAVTMSRRKLISSTAAAAATIILTSSPQIMTIAEAAVMENTQTTFKVGEAISVNAAKARLVEARESLQYLVDNYDDIVKKGGGDNVRRYLGTVGTSSGLYGISKVLKTLQEEATDIVEYTELANDFEQALRDADTACYSAIFVEFSAAKTKPEKFFNDAKNDVTRMQTYFKDLTAQLNL